MYSDIIVLPNSFDTISKFPTDIADDEIFKFCFYHENFLVSNFGRVWNIKTQRYIKQSNNKKKYKHMNMCKMTRQIHTLVAELFVIQTCKDRIVVDHIDRNKHNNHYSNLQWLTRAENNMDRWKPVEAFKNGVFVKRFCSAKEAAEELHCDAGDIASVCKGRLNAHKGYTFRYSETPNPKFIAC